MLLDLIKETVKVCPETFVSVVQHSNTPQLSKHSKFKWKALQKQGKYRTIRIFSRRKILYIRHLVKFLSMKYFSSVNDYIDDWQPLLH